MTKTNTLQLQILYHLLTEVSTSQKPEAEKEFKVQPIHDNTIGDKFSAYKAKPGPAIPDNMPGFEGTKEERLAKAKEMNK